MSYLSQDSITISNQLSHISELYSAEDHSLADNCINKLLEKSGIELKSPNENVAGYYRARHQLDASFRLESVTHPTRAALRQIWQTGKQALPQNDQSVI